MVYITHSHKEASKLSELFSNQKNFVTLSISNNKSESEYYYLPRAALNYIKSLVEDHTSQTAEKKSIKKKNILLCYDDITTYILNEKNIFQTARCNIASTNIFAEIRESCGDFPKPEYSLTCVLIAEKNRNNYEFEGEYEKNLSNIYSFTDKIVKFDTNLTILKSMIKN